MQRSIDSLVSHKLQTFEEKLNKSDLSLRQTMSHMNEKIKGFDKRISRHSSKEEKSWWIYMVH